ncbi:hypothetical protein C0J52_01221 [Blattella germanica]|nr:hypothetical protein C0J52_01221 [Blattella germanica]
MNKKRNKDLRGSVVINAAIHDSLDVFPPLPIFCATQSAIIGFSRSIGDTTHYERTGVRVVALCPGVSKEHILASTESHVQLNSSWGLDLEKLSSKDCQSDSTVGYGVVDIVRYAQSGTVWVINNNREMFYADIPDRSLYNKPGPGSLRSSYCTAPILVPKPQRRPSSSDARSYKCISKLHSYRVKGKKRKLPSQK